MLDLEYMKKKSIFHGILMQKQVVLVQSVTPGRKIIGPKVASWKAMSVPRETFFDLFPIYIYSSSTTLVWIQNRSFQDNGSLYLTIVQTWLDMERERVYEISGLFHHLFHDFQTTDAKKKTSWDVFLVSVGFRNRQRDG